MQNSEKFGKEQSYSNQTQGSAELVSWLLCWLLQSNSGAGGNCTAGGDGAPWVAGDPRETVNHQLEQLLLSWTR